MSRTVELPAPGRGAYDRSLTRAERDAQHRERLVRATAEVLFEGGVSVARVVERAGVGRSTFYEFFDSPEHVIAHLEQRTSRSLEDAMSAAYAGAHTPLERLRAVLRAWLSELEARGLEAKVTLARRSERELLSSAGKLLHAALERIVESARRDGMSTLSSSDEVSVLAAAAAVEAVTRRHLLGQALPDAPRTLSELVVKLLR